MWPGQVHSGICVQGGQELHQGLNVAWVDHLDGVICAGVVRVVVNLIQRNYSGHLDAVGLLPP